MRDGDGGDGRDIASVKDYERPQNSVNNFQRQHKRIFRCIPSDFRIERPPGQLNGTSRATLRNWHHPHTIAAIFNGAEFALCSEGERGTHGKLDLGTSTLVLPLAPPSLLWTPFSALRRNNSADSAQLTLQGWNLEPQTLQVRQPRKTSNQENVTILTSLL